MSTQKASTADDKLKSVLEEALAVVKERMQSYGSPKNSFEKTAKMWSAFFGRTITPHDVCMCLALLKISRESFHTKRDNRVDVCGYMECAEQSLGEDDT